MSIASIVTTSLLEIATIEEKYFKTKLFSTSLACASKRDILEAYYETIEDFLVIICGFSQYKNIIRDDYSCLKKLRVVFKEKNKEILAKKGHISSKMLIMFESLIHNYEYLFFDEIDKILSKAFSDNVFEYEKMLNIIFDLAEIAALTLSGIRLSCKNIKNEILEQNVNYNLDLPAECKETCPFTKKGRDCLHIFVSNETVSIPTWAEKILSIFAKYYNNPKELTIFIDYKLIDSYEWDEDKYQTFCKYNEIFGAYYFVNVENVNFSKWIDEVDVVPFDYLSSCVLS